MVDLSSCTHDKGRPSDVTMSALYLSHLDPIRNTGAQGGQEMALRVRM